MAEEQPTPPWSVTVIRERGLPGSGLRWIPLIQARLDLIRSAMIPVLPGFDYTIRYCPFDPDEPLKGDDRFEIEGKFSDGLATMNLHAFITEQKLTELWDKKQLVFHIRSILRGQMLDVMNQLSEMYRSAPPGVIPDSHRP